MRHTVRSSCHQGPQEMVEWSGSQGLWDLWVNGYKVKKLVSPLWKLPQLPLAKAAGKQNLNPPVRCSGPSILSSDWITRNCLTRLPFDSMRSAAGLLVEAASSVIWGLSPIQLCLHRRLDDTLAVSPHYFDDAPSSTIVATLPVLRFPMLQHLCVPYSSIQFRLPSWSRTKVAALLPYMIHRDS